MTTRYGFRDPMPASADRKTPKPPILFECAAADYGEALAIARTQAGPFVDAGRQRVFEVVDLDAGGTVVGRLVVNGPAPRQEPQRRPAAAAAAPTAPAKPEVPPIAPDPAAAAPGGEPPKRGRR